MRDNDKKGNIMQKQKLDVYKKLISDGADKNLTFNFNEKVYYVQIIIAF